MFSEPLQLLVAPGENNWTDTGFDAGLVSRVRSAAEEIADSPEEVALEECSVGHGADALAILITIGAAFLAGKQIEESFDAWVRMAARLKTALRKLRGVSPALYVSEPAAAFIAFDHVLGKLPVDGTITLTSSSALLVDAAGVPAQFRRSPGTLAERYYVFHLLDSSGDTHVVCVRSTGDIELHHVLKTGSWQGFHGIE